MIHQFTLIFSYILLFLAFTGIKTCDGFGCFYPLGIGGFWCIIVVLYAIYALYSIKPKNRNNPIILVLYFIGLALFAFWAITSGHLGSNFQLIYVLVSGLLISSLPLSKIFPISPKK